MGLEFSRDEDDEISASSSSPRSPLRGILRSLLSKSEDVSSLSRLSSGSVSHADSNPSYEPEAEGEEGMDTLPTFRREYIGLSAQGNGNGRVYVVTLTSRVLEYEGEFSHFQKSGRGKLYNAAGTAVLYYGEFLNDERHGFGAAYLPNGAKHFGEWRSGRCIGYLDLDPGVDLTSSVQSQRHLLRQLYVNPDRVYRGQKLLRSGASSHVFKLRLRLPSHGPDAPFRFFAFKFYSSFDNGWTLDDALLEIGLCYYLDPHPNIITPFGFSRDPPGIITELLFQDVARCIIAGVLSLRDKIRIVWDVVRGMKHLHSRHILHRDLKWANVMVTKPFLVGERENENEENEGDWRAVLIDFGLSQICESYRLSTNRQGEEATVVGTAGKIAPEVIRHAEYKYPADVFSFGIMLYELFGNRAAYSRTGARERIGDRQLLKKVAKGFRPKIKKLRRVLRDENPLEIGVRDFEWLIKLMTSCWSQRASLRPSFDQIWNILERELSGSNRSASPVPAPSLSVNRLSQRIEVPDGFHDPFAHIFEAKDRAAPPASGSRVTASMHIPDIDFSEDQSLNPTDMDAPAANLYSSMSNHQQSSNDANHTNTTTTTAGNDPNKLCRFFVFKTLEGSIYTRITISFTPLVAAAMFQSPSLEIRPDLFLEDQDVTSIRRIRLPNRERRKGYVEFRIEYDRRHRRDEILAFTIRVLPEDATEFRGAVIRMMDFADSMRASRRAKRAEKRRRREKRERKARRERVERERGEAAAAASIVRAMARPVVVRATATATATTSTVKTTTTTTRQQQVQKRRVRPTAVAAPAPASRTQPKKRSVRSTTAPSAPVAAATSSTTTTTTTTTAKRRQQKKRPPASTASTSSRRRRRPHQRKRRVSNSKKPVTTTTSSASASSASESTEPKVEETEETEETYSQAEWEEANRLARFLMPSPPPSPVKKKPNPTPAPATVTVPVPFALPSTKAVQSHSPSLSPATVAAAPAPVPTVVAAITTTTTTPTRSSAAFSRVVQPRPQRQDSPPSKNPRQLQCPVANRTTVATPPPTTTTRTPTTTTTVRKKLTVATVPKVQVSSSTNSSSRSERLSPLSLSSSSSFDREIEEFRAERKRRQEERRRRREQREENRSRSRLRSEPVTPSSSSVVSLASLTFLPSTRSSFQSKHPPSRFSGSAPGVSAVTTVPPGSGCNNAFFYFFCSSSFSSFYLFLLTFSWLCSTEWSVGLCSTVNYSDHTDLSCFSENKEKEEDSEEKENNTNSIIWLNVICSVACWIVDGKGGWESE